MKSRLKSLLTDIVVVLGFSAAVGMSVAIAAIAGAIMSLIFGGSTTAWASVFCVIDLVAVVVILGNLIRDYWKDYERRTNM